MRKSARLQRIKSETIKKPNWRLIKLIIIPAFLLAILLFIKSSTRHWNGSDKLSYAYINKDGDVAVTVLDPKLSEETTMIIPGDTQVNVAGGYGLFRIKNVWQLGVNEKMGGGQLLSSTITKNFLFPVNLWANENVANLEDGSLFGAMHFVFAPGGTDIPFGDRLAMALFALRVQSINKTDINLGTSKFLNNTTLSDGQPGYVLNGNISERLTIYFSDNNMANSNLTVEISDATGQYGLGNQVGQIIQVLGGKVVSVDKIEPNSDLDCLVTGENHIVDIKIATVFGCKVSANKGNFDVEVRLGEKFANRF